MFTVKNLDIDKFKLLKHTEYKEFLSNYLISCNLSTNNFIITNNKLENNFNNKSILIAFGSNDLKEYNILLDFFDLLCNEFKRKKIDKYIDDFDMII